MKNCTYDCPNYACSRDGHDILRRIYVDTALPQDGTREVDPSEDGEAMGGFHVPPTLRKPIVVAAPEGGTYVLPWWTSPTVLDGGESGGGRSEDEV